MDIRFSDHPAFHRAAAGMVGVSAILGVALYPITSASALVGGGVGILAGAMLGYGTPWRGLGGWRALLTVAVAPFVVLVAMWTALRFGHAAKLEHVPAIARAGMAAAAMGMVAVLALLPRHLSISSDPVSAAVRRLPANLDGELADLCKRSVAIWTQTKDQLGDRDAGKTLVRDGVLKALEVAAKSAQVKLAGANDAELTKRAADLDARIAAATDAEVKTQYEAARGAVGDQLRYREQIKQGGERLVARMHNHVAALEKFQLAATGLEHARAASAGATAVKQLAELSQDVAASGEALAELELGTAGA